MIDEKQIKQWVDNNVITQEQADRMLIDISQRAQTDRSGKFITAISVIGAVLLGIGAIVFVAANWQGLPRFVKILILFLATFGTYYSGFSFKYDRRNFPRVGGALFLLSALLFGASIFLIAQMYHVNANSPWLVLLWLIGILPLVYVFVSTPIALLSAILFLIWIILVVLKNEEYFFDMLPIVPLIYVLSGALLFSIGGLHYFYKSLSSIARIFRIVGIEVVMICLYLLTFNELLEDIVYEIANNDFYANLSLSILVLTVVSIIGIVINLYFNPAKSKTNTFENIAVIGILLLTIEWFFVPYNAISSIIFNVVFFLINILLIYFGYRKADIKLVNMGVLWLSIFIFTKYFTVFFGMFNTALFFFVGGAILMTGGMFFEKKRKNMKQEFLKINTEI